ncbi:hypothetical protein BU23DRAFT_553980 [Bimuria novae-zelandiae CBS 107.79]|uniref:Uncharacterized protein n=1 Tax=Bimuria novae-zelandiae CBS 107.79 TaxID=1447943 RepID=A0A6A5VCF1_9PLEO|nr:hypothetical protein BU23DRAFT_553980 [Bimuria novae-zelandiae CBS 107.79]
MSGPQESDEPTEQIKNLSIRTTDPPSQRESRESPYGFVVYRTDYTSDDRWKNFMSFLNAQTRSTLLSSNFSDLLDGLDWHVQEASELNEADYDQVREHFKTWLTTNDPQNGHPRFQACVVVDDVCLSAMETALEDGTPEDFFDNEGYTHVYLVSKNEEEGYQAVGVSYLLPYAYNVLAEKGWEGIKQRYEEDVALPGDMDMTESGDV